MLTITPSMQFTEKGTIPTIYCPLGEHANYYTIDAVYRKGYHTYDDVMVSMLA
jgi:hypothetical protein